MNPQSLPTVTEADMTENFRLMMATMPHNRTDYLAPLALMQEHQPTLANFIMTQATMLRELGNDVGAEALMRGCLVTWMALCGANERVNY